MQYKNRCSGGSSFWSILVPSQVNIYQMYQSYFEDVPSIFVSLYLGPLSGKSFFKSEKDGIG